MKARKSDCNTVNDVMKRISHADLLSHYLGINTLPVLINSPLRNDDIHPSFFIYSPDGTKVLYKDFATGDRGDIYSLLSHRHNLTFAQLIRKIASEDAFISSTSITFEPSTRKDLKQFERTTSDLRVKTRGWEPYDIEYWETFGITMKWLKYADVYPVSHIILYKNDRKYVFHAAKLSYAFVERKENNISLKCYQPLVKNKRRKWLTSNNGSVVGLWTKIPEKGNKLVICSSLKDALCLWANTGIPAIYVQSETTGMSQTAQEVLKGRYKNIFICFDNDAPGIIDGEKFSEQTGFTNIVLPPFEGGKDIADLYKVKGRDEFKKIMTALFE